MIRQVNSQVEVHIIPAKERCGPPLLTFIYCDRSWDHVLYDFSQKILLKLVYLINLFYFSRKIDRSPIDFDCSGFVDKSYKITKRSISANAVDLPVTKKRTVRFGLVREGLSFPPVKSNCTSPS